MDEPAAREKLPAGPVALAVTVTVLPDNVAFTGDMGFELFEPNPDASDDASEAAVLPWL